MWIARIARPGAIYDASAAAQTFSGGKIIDVSEEKEDILEIKENGDFRKKGDDSDRIPGFSEFAQGWVGWGVGAKGC